MTNKPFWKTKNLEDFNEKEWESVCDRCAKFCLLKIIDEDTNKVQYTNVTCHLLDIKNCQCTNYKKRREILPDCIKLTRKNLKALDWMPNTCAYKLLNDVV